MRGESFRGRSESSLRSAPFDFLIPMASQVHDFFRLTVGKAYAIHFSSLELGQQRDSDAPDANSELMVPPLTAENEARAMEIFNSMPERVITFGQMASAFHAAAGVIAFGGPSSQMIASAFHAAAASGSLELLKAMTQYVLEDQGRIEAKRWKRLSRLINNRGGGLMGRTPLMLAAMLGHASCVRFLVEKGADCLESEMQKGHTAIHFATREGHPECIDALITAEPEPHSQHRTHPSEILNCTTTSGFSSLHYAVAFHRHECLETLLKYNPDVASRSIGIYSHEIGMYCATGTTPLHVAASVNNVRAAVSILRHYAERRAIRGAVTTDPRWVKDSSGRTASLVARQRARERIIDYELIELLSPETDLLSNLQIQLPTFGPPKLSVIVAGVLKAKLLTEIQKVSEHYTFERSSVASKQPSSPTALVRIEVEGARTSASGVRVLSSSSATLNSEATSPSSDLHFFAVNRNPSPIGRKPSVIRDLGVRPFEIRETDATTPNLEKKKVDNNILAASEALMAEMEGVGARGIQDLEAVAAVQARAETPGATTTSAVCFICFDAEPDLTITGCRHKVCGACAKAMVEKVNPIKILACPFCRKSVGGFEV